MPDLSTSYLGLQLKNPIIVGSSGLTDSVEKIKNLEDMGAAAVVLKSLFEEEIIIEMEETIHSMTNRNFVFPETMDYMETIVKDDLLLNYLELIADAKKAVEIPIIASINCVSSQKWTYFAKEIEKAGADALELNLFFLPSDNLRGEKEIMETTFDIISKVKGIVRIPVALKISSFQSNLIRYVQHIDQAGIEGIVLFNRSWLPDIDINNLVISSGFVLSSPSDLGNTLRWVSMVSGRVNCDIVASTGIHDGAGLIKQLLAGAHACQVVSTLYIHETSHILKMTDELSKWMEVNEFDSIEEFRGRLSQSNSGNPAAWERVQFMKHFRNFV
ncbi:MAG TPA: dihydroorotate dehydrogenase-like protein [Prolixibacteraceae bacterium]|nr:dihydroorotate dehydrogenase-like protein [Prolixibacteraceae bacterium]